MHVEIDSEDKLRALLLVRTDLRGVIVHAVDLRPLAAELARTPAAGAVFLGCTFDPPLRAHVIDSGGTVFPELPGLEFRPYRASLYTADELLEGYRPGEPRSLFASTRDARIYRQYQTSRSKVSLLEALAQRLHDHAIDLELAHLLAEPPRKVVAVMGGHSMPRTATAYRDVARISRRLAEGGYLMASGGGPGAMEATNLGAWMSRRDPAELDRAIERLGAAPTYRDEGWLELALDARAAFPGGAESLGVPTWFYGHEPSNVFATHIAKYFSNSLREDGMLAIARHGVIFAPGSAGTIQEIFQDAAQNHYATYLDVSPMVLLGRSYWTEQRPAWPLLEALAAGRGYREMLALEDDVDAVVRFIEDHPPTRPAR
jgi:predicted Rossmann-fold nucleotide-binding protein